jgi:phosphate uptake regulator
VSKMIADVAEIFRQSDTEAARALLTRGDELLDDFDDRVSALVRGENQGPHAIATALLHRYLKRVVAHLMNVLSSVVMPVDRLDYFDEDPEDRGT